MTNELFAADASPLPELDKDGPSLSLVDPELLAMLPPEAEVDVSLEGKSPHASTVAASPSLLPASVDAPLLVDAPPSCLRVVLKLMGSSFNLVVVRFSLPTCRPPAPCVMS